MNSANNSSINAIKSYVEQTTPADEALAAAAEAAREFGLLVPDAVTAELLRFLAANTAGRAALGGHTPTGIIMSPACGLLGSHLFRGFYAAAATQAHLTCIEPEVQHQQLAKNAFKQIGITSNGFRFLPSHPLDVIGRLASTSYDLAIAECAVEDIEATVAATLPTLRSGGVLLLLDTLLDGTLADAERTDRQSICAREADEYITSLAGVTAARLPVGAGATIITKH